jgi:hypothetical protein
MNEIKTAVNGLAARFGHENKTELSFSVAQIEAMGTTPLELLPAPTAGKTYAFYLVLKKALGLLGHSVPNLFIFGAGMGIISMCEGLYFGDVEARIVHANSGIPSESFTETGSDYPQVSSLEQDNDALTLTTWDGDNPTGGNVGLTGTIYWTEI